MLIRSWRQRLPELVGLQEGRFARDDEAPFTSLLVHDGRQELVGRSRRGEKGFQR